METLQDIMTPDPVVVGPDDTVGSVARQMRDRQIGDVLVCEDDRLVGIVTDRDLAVRVVAESIDPEICAVRDVLSEPPLTMATSATIHEAAECMRTKAVRRLPVVDDGRVVGIVSIGDLAIQADPESALADISLAPATN